MAHQHFVANGSLAEAASERLIVKQRIVTEATRAASFLENPPFHRASECAHQLAILHQRDHAHEACGAIQDIRQARQQQSIVRRISSVRTREACRAYSRRSAQRIHFQAGIIGE